MFHRCLFIVIATVVCCSVVSPAQEARIFGDSDKLAIDQMYDRYVKAFITKDYTSLREYVKAPFVVLTGGKMQTLQSLDAVLTVYRNLREPLEQRNYDHTEIFGTRITPLTADSALVNKAYRRYKKDGSLLEEGAAVYPVSKSSGGAWKLRGLVLQELQYFGKVY